MKPLKIVAQPGWDIIKNYNKNVRWLKSFKENMSFQLLIYSLWQIKMECKGIKYRQKRQDKNNKKSKSKVKMCKLGDYCLKRILYWFGIGLDFLSACLVAEVCQASKVFLMQKEPLSMTLGLSKSMWWSNDHACFAMFDPLAHFLTFLICSFLKPPAW